MGRKRKHNIDLPKHVHCDVKRGTLYLTFQKHRNTERAGPRIKIPHSPDTPEFWETYYRLLEMPANQADEHSVQALVAKYRASAEWRALKPVTRRDYDRYLSVFEDRLGEFQAAEVTPRVLLEMRDSFDATPVAANHLIAVIKTLYRFGVPRGFATENPARELRPIPVRSDGAKPWPQWALDLLLDGARHEIRTFVALGLFTGQRTADILKMRLQDIDGDAIAVRQSKTDKRLFIPIHRDLAPFIDAVRKRGTLIFVPGPRGDELDTNRWRAMWGRELKKEPFQPIKQAALTPHGLRKSAVVSLREVGCRMEEIQAITGQSRQMVEHYAKGVDQKKMARRAIRKWENEDKLR